MARRLPCYSARYEAMILYGVLFCVSWLFAGALLQAPPATAVREYHLELTHHYANSDGNYKTCYLVNGQSPGPAIEGDEGDWVRVTVSNLLPVSVTIHFHGVLQKGTPWADGVPGITQYPIISGDTFVYEFQLRDQCGATWYHAHYRGYASDGIYGPMFIRPAKDRKRPYHMVSSDPEDIREFFELEKLPQFLIAEDSFKLPMDDVMARMFHYGIDPLCIQSILINGKGRVSCHDYSTFTALALKKPGLPRVPSFDTMGCVRDEKTNGYHDFELDHFGLENPGFLPQCRPTYTANHVTYTNGARWQYINVLNAGGQYTKAFSIDDHDLWVVAIDGVFVEAQKVQQLLIPVGSRYTILVETDPSRHVNNDKPFAMRFNAIVTPQYIEGVGLMVYGNEETEKDTVSEAQSSRESNHGTRFLDLDGSLLSPSYRTLWPRETAPYEKGEQLIHKGPADHTFHMFLNRTGVVDFSMFEDGTKLPVGFELGEPLLFKHNEPSFDFSRFNGSLVDGIRKGDVVDLIINNYKRIAHPVHIHGHLFHQVSYSDKEGFSFESMVHAIAGNYSAVNIDNPPLFDIALVPPGGHVVLRLVADNPGIWLIHCHNLGHLLGGMGAVLVEAVEDIPLLPPSLREQAHVIHDIHKDPGVTEVKNNTHDGSLWE